MEDKETKPFAHPELVKKLSDGNVDFVVELYKRCSSQSEGNTFLSPFSITAAVGMMLVGARGNTQEQIRSTLGLGMVGDDEDVHVAFEEILKSVRDADRVGLQLLAANAMYLQRNLSVTPEFRDVLQTRFDTIVEEVDFVEDHEKVRGDINQWVEGITKTRIKDLLAPGILDESTLLVLVNAIYFKGDWALKFDPQETATEKFHISKTETVDVDMMHKSDKFRFKLDEELQCSVLEMPYVGERLAMYLILPKEIDGLASLEANLTGKHIQELLEFQYYPTTSVVTVPKFRIESSFSLNETLKKMGMGDMFTDAADLSGITGNRDLVVSAVVHKAFLEVNEEGSEAAAATAMVAVPMCYIPPKEFTADHPFLIVIKDKLCGLILFMGRVMNPST